MQGITDFTYGEARNIRDALFPGMSIEYLFDQHEDRGA